MTAQVEGRLARVGDPVELKCTDFGNAERLVLRYGQDLRYCYPWKTWLVWDGQRWAVDRDGEVERRAEAADTLDHERRERLGKWAVTNEAGRHLKEMVTQAQSEFGITVVPEALDRDPWLFNVQNGTLDLRTGRLRRHRREDLITTCAPVDDHPHATCPQWLQFLHDIMAGQTTMVDYLQRTVGYSLTGSVREQCFFFCYGTGDNGKSTFLEVLLALTGPYGMQAVRELLMVRHHDAHPTERADLYQGSE